MRAILILLLCAPAFAAGPYKPPDPTAADQQKMKAHYEAAFRLFTEGHYSRAIGDWEEVLKTDQKQTTAAQMIKTAREKIDERDKAEQNRTLAYVAAGRYQRALVELQKLLERDATHPMYQAWQTRLMELMRIVPTAPKGSRAWSKAVIGLTGYVARQEDLQLAYNGLRYAQEIAPKEKVFEDLIELVLAAEPALKQDKPTAGMKILDYKRFVALNHIYDGKYNLAVRNLEQVLQLEPQDLTALKRLGSAYYSLKQYQRAKETWLRALTLAPSDHQLKRFLARTERSRRNTRSN